MSALDPRNVLKTKGALRSREYGLYKPTCTEVHQDETPVGGYSFPEPRFHPRNVIGAHARPIKWSILYRRREIDRLMPVPPQADLEMRESVTAYAGPCLGLPPSRGFNSWSTLLLFYLAKWEAADNLRMSTQHPIRTLRSVDKISRGCSTCSFVLCIYPPRKEAFTERCDKETDFQNESLSNGDFASNGEALESQYRGLYEPSA
jgi:hypothetical protein